MNKALAALAAIYIIAVVLSLSGNLYALPEYGVRYGQSCQLCHTSVSGAGMRTLYGAQFFSYTDLPSHPVDFNDIGKHNPMINDRIQLGMDFRSLYYNKTAQTSALNESSFLAMEGNLYMSYMASDKTFLYLSKGLYNTFEAWGQTQALPWEMALKFGRFMPNFGWHFVDHRTFVRRFTGFGSTAGIGNVEDGVELGHYNERDDISIALTNGPTAGPIDSNTGKAVTARAAKRIHLNTLNITLGGSYRYLELGQNTGPYTRMGGVFYGANLGRVTLLGEADVIAGTASGYAVSNLLRFDLRPGVALSGALGYYDPDIDLQTGNYWRVRTALDYTPYGYVTISPAIEYNSTPQVQAGVVNNQTDVTAEVQIHLWY